MIYSGRHDLSDQDLLDLPSHLPRPLIIGQRVYTRVKSLRNGLYGVYGARIESVFDDCYRVALDKGRNDEFGILSPQILKVTTKFCIYYILIQL